jgi:hypothetical protein
MAILVRHISFFKRLVEGPEVRPEEGLTTIKSTFIARKN